MSPLRSIWPLWKTLDYPPVAGWSDAERLAAVKAQQALSILDADKALFLLPLFAQHFEERQAAWDRMQRGPREG